MSRVAIATRKSIHSAHLVSTSNHGRAKQTRRFTSMVQYKALIEFVSSDLVLARSGSYCAVEVGRPEVNRRWVYVAKKLNELEGTTRTVKEWKKIWSDFRNRMKKGLAPVPEKLADFINSEKERERPRIMKSQFINTENITSDSIWSDFRKEMKKEAAAVPEKPDDLDNMEKLQGKKIKERLTNTVNTSDSNQDGRHDLDTSGPMELNYVNCSESSDDSQGEHFSGWHDKKPMLGRFLRQPSQTNDVLIGPENETNGQQEQHFTQHLTPPIHLTQLDSSCPDPRQWTRDGDLYTELLKRLVDLEELRKSSDAERAQQLGWCARQLVQLEKRRLALDEKRLQQDRQMEEKRVELERRRLRIDRARLLTDRAMHSTLQKLLEKYSSNNLSGD